MFFCLLSLIIDDLVLKNNCLSRELRSLKSKFRSSMIRSCYSKFKDRTQIPPLFCCHTRLKHEHIRHNLSTANISFQKHLSNQITSTDWGVKIMLIGDNKCTVDWVKPTFNDAVMSSVTRPGHTMPPTKPLPPLPLINVETRCFLYFKLALWGTLSIENIYPSRHLFIVCFNDLIKDWVFKIRDFVFGIPLCGLPCIGVLFCISFRWYCWIVYELLCYKRSKIY